MKDLEKMSLTELKELKDRVGMMIQLIQPSLQVGMKCSVDHHKVRGLVGEIFKVNRTKCKVKFGRNITDPNGTTFNVPKSMIILGHPDGSGMQC